MCIIYVFWNIASGTHIKLHRISPKLIFWKKVKGNVKEKKREDRWKSVYVTKRIQEQLNCMEQIIIFIELMYCVLVIL